MAKRMTAPRLRELRAKARLAACDALDRFPDFDGFDRAARLAVRARLPGLAALCRDIRKREEAASVAYNRLARSLGQ